MQDQVATSDLVSHLEYTGYMNNAVFVSWRGSLWQLLFKSDQLFFFSFQSDFINSDPLKSPWCIPMRPEGDLRLQPQVQLLIPHQAPFTAS